MSRKIHKPEAIIAKLRQVDVLTAQGTPVADAVRSNGVTEVDHHRELEAALQCSPPPCLAGLQTSGSGGVCAGLRRLAGCPISPGSAGQEPRSAKTNPQLTFNPHHPTGADQ